jgi:anti-anti-sigma factor
MDISRHNGTLHVTGIRELKSPEAQTSCSALGLSLPDGVRTIEIDLSQVHEIDGAGLGALVSLYETANTHGRQGGITVRLTNLAPPVQQIIELARLHHLFELESPQNIPAD